jgi:uncharacterized membrane protein
MNHTALSHLLAGLAILAFSYPLVKQMIGPNRFYGIRTREAFESREQWYKINEHGGRLFLRWGILVTAIGLVGLALPRSLWFAYIWASLALIIGSLVVVIKALRRFTRRLKDPQDSP